MPDKRPQVIEQICGPKGMDQFKVVAFTHKTTELKDIGRLHIEDQHLADRLHPLKNSFGVDELLYLSTCNRVEFVLHGHQHLDKTDLHRFFTAFAPTWHPHEVQWAIDHCVTYEGDQALQHLYYVASSIDSLVVGEREIITQVRQAYEKCHDLNLTGDNIRLLIKTVIETAKRIYTETQIAQNPVSVVSLAYRQLMELDLPENPRVVMVGSGQTNRTMAEYLRKSKLGPVHVFNRTPHRAIELAQTMRGSGHALSDLHNHTDGFDVLITCTGAAEPVIDNTLLVKLVGHEKSVKTIVDLALPSDLADGAISDLPIHYIGLNRLKDQARKNLEERQRELEKCKKIVNEAVTQFGALLREREVERAMAEIPHLVHDIRQKALTEVFARDLAHLDPEARAVLEKVMDYVEKKYISIPIKRAKEVMLGAQSQKGTNRVMPPVAPQTT